MSTNNVILYPGLRNSARILIGIWTAFWLYFAIASSIQEKMAADILFIGTIVLIPAIIAWIWETLGAYFMLIIGIIILFGYPVMMSGLKWESKMISDLLLGSCPFTAGVLMLIRLNKINKLKKRENSSGQ